MIRSNNLPYCLLLDQKFQRKIKLHQLDFKFINCFAYKFFNSILNQVRLRIFFIMK